MLGHLCKYSCLTGLDYSVLQIKNKNCQQSYSRFQTSQTRGQWHNDTSPFSIYCKQPFVSETTRCVSNDFIVINDDAGQNVVCFYVWRIGRGRELPSGETEKEEVWGRELMRKKDTVGAKIRTFSQTTNRNVIWKLGWIVSKRWSFSLDKLLQRFFSFGDT